MFMNCALEFHELRNFVYMNYSWTIPGQFTGIITAVDKNLLTTATCTVTQKIIWRPNQYICSPRPCYNAVQSCGCQECAITVLHCMSNNDVWHSCLSSSRPSWHITDHVNRVVYFLHSGVFSVCSFTVGPVLTDYNQNSLISDDC